MSRTFIWHENFPFLLTPTHKGFIWVSIFNFAKPPRYKLLAKGLLPVLYSLMEKRGSFLNSKFSIFPSRELGVDINMA